MEWRESVPEENYLRHEIRCGRSNYAAGISSRRRVRRGLNKLELDVKTRPHVEQLVGVVADAHEHIEVIR